MTEIELLDRGREAFQKRIRNLGIKPKGTKYHNEMMSFAEGFLEAGILCGVLSQDTRKRAIFLCMCGRLDEWFGPKKEGKPL